MRIGIYFDQISSNYLVMLEVMLFPNAVTGNGVVTDFIM